MATWTKKTFESTGVTEYPAGAGLTELARRFGGRVMLALDVSGSMAARDSGPDHAMVRLEQAIAGCERFIAEAVAAHYQVGLVLWHHDVEGSVPPDASAAPALQLLHRARAAGGNNAVPFLELCHRLLMETPADDLVVAIFGDGDLGNRETARAAASKLVADNIRILTCGLGDSSAKTLAEISTEAAAPRAAAADTIAESIASMARGLKKR